MSDTEVINSETIDELTTLKARADLLGITYHPSIGLEKLKEKVNAAVVSDAPAVPEATKKESVDSVRARKRREANELVRIRVTCMNPAKKEWDGEILSVGNSLVGTFTKYVPFNNDEGWHVPRIIYEQLVERQCQIFTTTRDSRGNAVRKGKLIREFAIEVLPNLTPEELAELAQRQAMSKSVG
jgi:hypothetical protein